MKFGLLLAAVSLILAVGVSRVQESSVTVAPDGTPNSTTSTVMPTSTTVPSVESTITTIEVTGSHDLIVDDDRPAPLRVRVDALGIDIDLLAVGVDDDGDFDVPRAGIGWYRHGPAPGTDGSAVLAAHVDFNGAPGAFFRLAELGVGDRIEIDGDDGMTRVFTVDDQVLYDKTALPADDLFREDGDEVLRLITCGGRFDPEARSYLGNRVVTAIPVEQFPTQ